MEQLTAYRKEQADRHKQAQEQKHERDKAKWIQVLKDIPLLTAAFEENGCIKVGASETLRMATPKLMQQLEELGTLMESKEFAWWKSDKEFVLAAVAASGDALEEVSDELKNDKDVVMIAVVQNSSALAYASNALQKDPEILALVAKNGDDMNMPPKNNVDEKQSKKRNMKDDREQAREAPKKKQRSQVITQEFAMKSKDDDEDYDDDKDTIGDSIYTIDEYRKDYMVSLGKDEAFQAELAEMEALITTELQ